MNYGMYSGYGETPAERTKRRVNERIASLTAEIEAYYLRLGRLTHEFVKSNGIVTTKEMKDVSTMITVAEGILAELRKL